MHCCYGIFFLFQKGRIQHDDPAMRTGCDGSWQLSFHAWRLAYWKTHEKLDLKTCSCEAVVLGCLLIMIFKSARRAEPQPEIDLELGAAPSERGVTSVTLTLWAQRMSMTLQPKNVNRFISCRCDSRSKLFADRIQLGSFLAWCTAGFNWLQKSHIFTVFRRGV